MKTIEKITARQVYDSRANPTVEVEMLTNSGICGRGIVPSGASTGIFEALELRDGGTDFGGKGVTRAIANINNIIAPALRGMDIHNQKEIDELLISLDGTPNKSRLGANAILGCSMAACNTAATCEGMPLYRYLGGEKAVTIPLPMIQIIGGGAHAKNSIDVQDFLVIPLAPSTFAEGYAAVVNIYKKAQEVFEKYGKPLSVADEGGLWPTGFDANEEVLKLLCESIEKAGFSLGTDVGIALDIASSEFYDEKSERYNLRLENRSLTREEFIDELCRWVKEYHVVSLEDGTSETDWEGVRLLTERLGQKIQLIGDDLFTTNIARIEKGVKQGAANAVLIKMNQIGTITETIDAIRFTQDHGYLPVISARSGETEDVTMVHLAVATNAGQMKVGSVARGERTVKWNEVIRIEERLGNKACYPGGKIFEKAGITF